MNNISHNQAYDLIQFKKDDGLSLEDQTALESHLQNCTQCLDYASTDTYLEINLPLAAPKPNLSDNEIQTNISRINIEFNHPNVIKRVFKPTARIVWVSLAIILITTFSGLYYSSLNPTSEATRTNQTFNPRTQENRPQVAALAWSFPDLPIPSTTSPTSTWIFSFKLDAHEHGATTVAFSPNGELIATGGGDKLVRIWRAADGELLYTLSGHTGLVLEVAFSPDGKILASASGDKTVRLWQVADGSLLDILEGHPGPVIGLAISPDGKLLAAGTLEGVWLWQLDSKQLLRKYENNEGIVSAIAFSPDGQFLAMLDRFLWLQRVSDGKILFKSAEKEANSLQANVVFSPDGNYLAENLKPRFIKLWRITKKTKTSVDLQLDTTTETKSGLWQDLAFSPDGLTLAQLHTYNVKLWTIGSDEYPQSPREGYGEGMMGENSLAYSPDGMLIASASVDGKVRVWQFIENVDEYLVTRPTPRLFARADQPYFDHEYTVPETLNYSIDETLFSLSLEKTETLVGFPIVQPGNLPDAHPFNNLRFAGAAYNPDTQAVRLRYDSLNSFPPVYITQRLANGLEAKTNIPDIGQWTHVETIELDNLSAEYVSGVWMLAFLEENSQYDSGDPYLAYITNTAGTGAPGTYPDGDWIYLNLKLHSVSPGTTLNFRLFWADSGLMHRVLRWQVGDIIYEVTQLCFGEIEAGKFHRCLEKEGFIAIAASMINQP